MGSLIIAGQRVQEMGPKYLDWTLTGLDATKEFRVSQDGLPLGAGGATGVGAKNTGSRRYATRPALRKYGPFPNLPKLDAVQGVVKKFILHHDGVSSSKICWDVLHNERGLSCHFLIDNDGTIYQTLDLALMGFHAAKYNIDSIGVEFCNRGILDDPNFYAGKPFPHPISDEYSINGHKMKSFDFTAQQYESFFELASVLVRVLPNLALEYPRDQQNPTKAAWGCLGPVDALGDSYPASAFAGFMGHYHCTTRKWDPGPFDFKKWIDKLRGRRVFPVSVPGAELDAGKPIIPEDPAKIPQAVQPYYDANELTAEGGFFPVGPWGVSRLWHGGIHLPAKAGDPVYAPFAGRVIAARTTASSTAIGSANFVLMRHDLNVASQPIRVYSLFMHLDENGAAESPPWMAGQGTPIDPEVGVDGYDEVVDAGALIGHVGTVGPDELNKAQLHFEIFSTQRHFVQKPDDPNPSPWKLIDGSATDRFCESEEINALIDSDKDGRLSRKELIDFYSGDGDKASLRDYITLHVSEWAPEPDWTESLRSSMRDFQKKTPKRKGKPPGLDDDDEDLPIAVMVEEQLTPFLWWTDTVAKALKLPNSGIVYHYHPTRFIEYVNGAFKSTDVKTDGQMIDDEQDKTGSSAFVEIKVDEVTDAHLKIENLVDGWDGDVPP